MKNDRRKRSLTILADPWLLISLSPGLSLEPLIGALSAGNAVVLKPSEIAPTCSSLLATQIPNYLDTKAVKIIQGGPTVGEQLLQQRWDKIFFTGFIKKLPIICYFCLTTSLRAFLDYVWRWFYFHVRIIGSAQIGRTVMAAAAKHLSPVTLELGGKCPAVFDTISSSFERKVDPFAKYL